MVKMLASSNKVTPQDWTQLISAVLENGPQLLWRCYFKEENWILEQHEKAKGLEISLDQILGKELYYDSQDQSFYDEHTMFLCSTAALKIWGRTQKPERELNHILRLNGVREKLLVTFYKN